MPPKFDKRAQMTDFLVSGTYLRLIYDFVGGPREVTKLLHAVNDSKCILESAEVTLSSKPRELSIRDYLKMKIFEVTVKANCSLDSFKPLLPPHNFLDTPSFSPHRSHVSAIKN